MKMDKNELIESVIIASISIIMAILFYFGWEKNLKTSLLVLIISLSSIILYSIFISFIPKEEPKNNFPPLKAIEENIKPLEFYSPLLKKLIKIEEEK